jgi:hypothetical protein
MRLSLCTSVSFFIAEKDLSAEDALRLLAHSPTGGMVVSNI